MFDNIIFIGGIHGVGKSTICRKICCDLNIEYLSASEVLKWENKGNKKVEDITNNQNKLVHKLKKLIKKDKIYLLDGHYCLLNENNDIKKVPIETFIQINPIYLFVFIEDIWIIKERLESRDNKLYDYSLLKEFQDMEIEYSKYLSEKINIPLYVKKNTNYLSIIDLLRVLISTKKTN